MSSKNATKQSMYEFKCLFSIRIKVHQTNWLWQFIIKLPVMLSLGDIKLYSRITNALFFVEAAIKKIRWAKMCSFFKYIKKNHSIRNAFVSL